MVLENGIYRQSLTIDTLNGTSANYITIRARNDGMAIIDGENVRRTVQIWDSSFINLEGIYAQNPYDPSAPSNSSAILVKGSNNINLRRVSGRKRVLVAGEASPIKIDPTTETGRVSHGILIEDAASYGPGRKSLIVDVSSYNITVRRYFALWDYFNLDNPWCTAVDFYGGHGNTFENVVVFNTGNGSCYGTANHGIFMGGTGQRTLGSIVRGINGDGFFFTGCNSCRIENSVAINNDNPYDYSIGIFSNVSRAPFCESCTQNIANKFTWISNRSSAHGVHLYGADRAGCPTQVSDITVSNSYFQGNTSAIPLYRNDTTSTMNHSNNRFSQNISQLYYLTTAGSNESRLTANFDTATYGDGAYLMASRTNLNAIGSGGSTIGADVIYRYVNGSLTNQPLWPWPMEDRIQREIGISVTWESGGGLWKTLDGVYSSTITPTPTGTPTSTPTPVPTLTYATPTSSLPFITPSPTPFYTSPTNTPSISRRFGMLVNMNAPEMFRNLQNIDFGDAVAIAVSFLLLISTLAFFFMLILGGIKWITSGGDKAKIAMAQSQITAALIGLVIIFSAWVILSIVENFFGVNLRSFNLNLVR